MVAAATDDGTDRPVIAVILAGGSGTRLYPATGDSRPKPLLSLEDDRSLLRRTADRVAFADETVVLTQRTFESAIGAELPAAHILTEPAPRDTGPALVYAAHRLRERVGPCTLLCLPCDHRIEGAFAEVALEATGAAVETGGLVTIGVEPSRPATSYGYIQPEQHSDGAGGLASDGPSYRRVQQFVEKPDTERARRYLDEGWLWNSGIFAWTPEALLSAVSSTPLEPLREALASGVPRRGFAEVTPVSIDTAVLEVAGERYVVPGTFDWADVGTWQGLARTLDSDGAGNVTIGDGTPIDSENCLLAGDESITAIGVSDLLVASFDGHTVVVPREEASRVSRLAEDARLEQDSDEE